MKLRKLILSGFKSFADRTEFDFDDGISCIVGPNGCGKSNVVDAVKWVLGEQSAKSLRGSEMQDVIFNGAASRKAMGHSTVTLVFDNSSGILQPSQEYVGANGQVSVTRRLFRSGQSEYLINKIPCRLRDIREMFMDTGIGSGAYGVIEQGQVAAFLQASHDERRKVFDEAAGISKYKSRKNEALRKLERVEQNLLRLTDVLGEVEKRLRSIKYQAGKARNYQVYSRQLNELKSLHFQSQYYLMSKARGELEKQLNNGNDSLSAITTRIDQLSAAHSASRVESEDLERSLRDLRVRTATLGGQITMWQERSDSHEARVKELGEQAVVLKSRCESLEAKVASLGEELAQRSAEKQHIKQTLQSLVDKYDVLFSAHQAGELELSRIEADLEDEKNGTMDLIRRAAQLHNEAQGYVIRRDSFDGQRTRLSGRAKEIAEACEQLVGERAAIDAKRNDVEEALEATRMRQAEANESSAAAAGDEQELQRELSEARQDRSGLSARAQTLSQMAERLDGVQVGARGLLEARRQGGLQCIIGMLGDFVQADVEHARLIEAALGGADQQLIADSLDNLAASADEIKSVLGDHGAVEIWCLDRLAQVVEDIPPVVHPKILARAIDWIRCDEGFAPAVRYALGRTLVVETLGDARQAATELQGEYRFLTRSGDVLECDGRVRLGWANRAAGLITRRSELDQLRGQLTGLDKRIADLEGRCRVAHSKREHLEELLQALRTAIYEDSMELTSSKGRLRQVDDQIAELKREEPLVAGELQQLANDINQADQAQQQARAKARELEQLNEQRRQQVQHLEDKMAAAKSRRNDQSGEMTEVKVALGQAREKTAALADLISNLKRQQAQGAGELESGRGEIAANAQRRLEAGEAIDKARGEIERLYGEHESLSRDAEDIEESRTGLKERLDQIGNDLTGQRRAHDEANKVVSACMARISEADANISNLIARASEDMGMDLLERFAGYSHDEERDWEAVAEDVRQLDEKIKRLGNVNLDAIDEQDELEARQALYAGQIQDIRDAQRQLDELINRINKESRQLFRDTFDAVRENFQELFRKLFGGGRADILLTDEEDVLESGIEIVARPPGKELRNLSLLSGGEKTMTALALLFSIFKCKPSPFCLLDEVDAALDEANTERFSRLLQEFTADSQFVVISHAKRTMSMASVLYGVTMQEAGVSKRISVRFEDAEKHLETNLQPAGV